MNCRNFWLRRRRTLLTLACLAAAPCFSQAPQQKISVPEPSQVVIKRGASAIATINVSTLPGYHVNSDKPDDEYLIPLRLTWDATPQIKLGAVEYPAAEHVQVGPDKLKVFTGTFQIKTELTAAQNAALGAAAVTGKIHYQACNDRMCFRPATLDVRVPVLIE